MKKTLLILVAIISIGSLLFGLIGCQSIKYNSDSTKGIRDLKTSSNSLTIMPTQSNNSISGENAKIPDYYKYINKVWVEKEWKTTETYEGHFSITIFKITNGKIYGRFSIEGISIPDARYNSSNYLENLTGSIYNGVAECQFKDSNSEGDNGNITLVFKKSDEIEATIKYTSKSKYNKDLSFVRTSLLRPYNLKDIDGFTPFKNQCFSVNLNSWGKVNFVSGKIIGGRHIPTVAYLTDNEGDFFYDFTSFIPNNVDFYAVSFQDVNKDGLKDIIVIYGAGDDVSSSTARIFTQKVGGTFIGEGKLTQEINDSGNNKDIKSIMDYISKKS